MALDFANAILGGQQIVGDYRTQALQSQALQQREQAGQWAQEDRAAEVQQRTDAQAQQAEYQQQLEQAMLSGNPQDIVRLMARFPQMREAITPMYEAMDETQRRTDTTQIGSIYANAQAGNFQRAADLLEERMLADGDADENDRAILTGLRSSDTVERNAAMATVGIMLAGVAGDDFSSMYGRINPSEATPAVQREYQWRVGQFGQQAADTWLATQDTELIPVEDGGSVYNKADFAVPTQRGGDPASSPPRLSDVVPFENWQTMPGLVRNGDVAVRVSSPQQAWLLPSGSRIVLPDGSEGRVP